MKFSTQRTIDLYFGTVVLLGQNLVARFLGFVLRRPHAVEPCHSILVAKFQGMGSLAIATPQIEAMKRLRPSAKIIFWGTPSTCTLARELSVFDEVIELNDRSLVWAFLSLVQNMRALWRLKLDWAFDLEPYSRLSSALITLTCARNRAGFAIDALKLRQNSHTHLVYFNRYKYLGEAYGQLLGLVAPHDASRSPIALQIDGQLSRFSRPLKKSPIDGPYVVINPHTGPLAPVRKWPTQSYGKLIPLLLHSMPQLKIALIGFGDQEIKDNAELINGLSLDQHALDRVVDLSGQLDFSQTLDCLGRANLVMSGDTGPLHLALLTHAPVLALYGPTQAETYLDISRQNTWFFQQKIYCSPCVHHWEPAPCGGDNQCMKRISVAQVASLAIEILNGKTTSASVTHATPRDRLAGVVRRRSTEGARAE